MTAPRWDQPLDPAEVKRLSPADRGRRTVASLERKVAILEAEAARPDPEDRRKDLPRDRAKLRRWASDDERLWAWSDPLFDKPGARNADLVRRFQAAVERLESKRRHGLSALREELRLERLRNVQLDGQVTVLIGQNRQLRVELRRCKEGRR